MKNVKTLSIIATFFLLFQMIATQMQGIVVHAAGNDDGPLVLKAVESNDDAVTWELRVNQDKEEMDKTEIKIYFSEGLFQGSVDKDDSVLAKESEAGYDVTIPEGDKPYKVSFVTPVEKAGKVSAKAETTWDGEKLTVSDEKEIKPKAKGSEKAESSDKDNGDKNKAQADDAKSKEKDSDTSKKKADTNNSDDNDASDNQGESDDKEKGNKEDVENSDENAGSDEKDKSDKEIGKEEDREDIGIPSLSIFGKSTNPNTMSTIQSNENWPNPGSLNLDKKANATGNFAEWEVELDVQGKNLKTSSDIVIVFDRSNSMYTSRLNKAKAAAKEFVDSLLIDENSTVKIALVPFGTYADPYTDFQGYSGKQTLKNAIDNITVTGGYDGGTNIQAGLHSASDLLSNSHADKQTIVLMSDGAPTYSFKAGDATDYSWPENKYNLILKDFDYEQQKGTGSDFTFNNYGVNCSSSFLWFCLQYKYHVGDNGIPTISEAQHIMNSGVDIYSIGLEVGNDANATYVLENSQNKGYVAGGDDDLTPIFENIAASIGFAATNAKVTDPLGDMFDLVKDEGYNGDNFSTSKGAVTWDDDSETFSWNIGNIKEDETYTLKYKITIDCAKNPKTNTEYPTNKTTTMHYKDYNGKDASKDFPIPEVSIDKGKITKFGYRVNVDGQPIDSDGNVVNPADAEEFYNELYKDNLTLNKTHSVPADETPDGYQLHSNFTDPASIELNKDVCNIAEFGYVKTSELPAGKVTAKYVDEAGNKIADSETFEGKLGESYKTEKKDIDGYEFVKMDEDGANPTGEFTTEEQTVIYFYKQLKGNIKLTKVDEDDEGIFLKGAKFDIMNGEQEVGTLETGEDGTATSESLPIGDYTLEEVEAPYGYEITSGQDLSVTVSANETVEITVTNKQLIGSIHIIKVDSENNNKLDGATFELQDEEGNKISTGTTEDGEYTFEDVVVGNYKLVETKAPEGYRMLKKPVEIEVTPDNLNVSKIIKNSKSDWSIPKTGGVGSLGFLVTGLLLMIAPGWMLFRRRETNN